MPSQESRFLGDRGGSSDPSDKPRKGRRHDILGRLAGRHRRAGKDGRAVRDKGTGPDTQPGRSPRRDPLRRENMRESQGSRGAGSSRMSRAAYSIKQNGPISFFAALIIVIFCLIQLFTTVQLYVKSTSELSSLKAQEASLAARKAGLENEISRWNDKAYVVAQARERLGFVYPGEQSIILENSKHKTGPSASGSSNAPSSSAASSGQKLPWYKEMLYSMQKADTTDTKGNNDGSRPSDRIPSQEEQQRWQNRRTRH